MLIGAAPRARSSRAIVGSTDGSAIFGWPTIDGYVRRKKVVKSSIEYMTPFGMPVVPPV